MSNMFYGVGDTYAKTKNNVGAIDQNIIVPLYLFDFEYTEDATALEAKGQVKGVKKTLASATGEITSTLRLSTQFVNWSQLGFFLNQLPSTQASVNIPVLKTGRVPATAPYEVADAGITALTASGVYVYISDDDDPSYREIITTGTVALGEVEVDSTAGSLTFHSSDAGKPFVYTLPVAQTNKQSYGGAGGDKYGTLEFWGTMYGTEDTIYFPSLDYKTTPSLAFTGDVATLEVEFSANVSVSDGDLYPYRIYRK